MKLSVAKHVDECMYVHKDPNKRLLTEEIAPYVPSVWWITKK